MAKAGSIFLNLLKSLTPQKIEGIIDAFKDTDAVLEAKEGSLRKVTYLTQRDIKEILRARKSDILDREIELTEREGIKAIDIFDNNYPLILKEVHHPPLVIYVKGKAEVLNEFLLAIVGSRIPTLYGISMAEEFSYQLSLLGIVIASGMARGIDSAAHKAAVKKGRSVAVLGSGLLNIYPKENGPLAEEIAKKGAVISEFPLKEPPLRENFPRRNRIISGLSRGVLIVEAKAKSGALITARLACEQNREVFALPGEACSPLSKGTHILIKEGAKLVDSVADILEDLPIDFTSRSLSGEVEKGSLSINLPPQERIIFDIIGNKGIYLEEIILQSKLALPAVNKAVFQLQIKGLIKEARPAYFVKNRNVC